MLTGQVFILGDQVFNRVIEPLHGRKPADELIQSVFALAQLLQL
jgi:hypothetical protein